MAIFFAVTAVVLAALLLRLLWREIGTIRDEFFQKARSRALQRLGVVATACCVVACALIVAQTLVLDREISTARASTAEVERLQLELARLQLTSRTAVAARRDPASPAVIEKATVEDAAAPSVPAEPKREAHAYVGAASIVVRSGPGKGRLFALQRGAPVTLRGDAQQVDGRDWQEIVIDDGRAGWVAASLLEPAT